MIGQFSGIVCYQPIAWVGVKINIGFSQLNVRIIYEACHARFKLSETKEYM